MARSASRTRLGGCHDNSVSHFHSPETVLNKVNNVRADDMRIEWGEMNVVAFEIAMHHSCCMQFEGCFNIL